MTKSQFRRPTRARGPRWLWIGLLVLIVIYMFARPVLQRQLGLEPPAAPPGSSSSTGPGGGLDAEILDGEYRADPADGSPRLPAGGADDGTGAEFEDDRAPLGQLTQVEDNVWVSTAGLRYTPGSQEGHRLKHVLRHDNDLADRPGKHGVFDGDQQTLLAVLDEAYELAKEGGSRVRSRREGERTVYEVDMQRRVGFVGGRDGARDGNPPARHIRLVLEDDRVITAFPY